MARSSGSRRRGRRPQLDPGAAERERDGAGGGTAAAAADGEQLGRRQTGELLVVQSFDLNGMELASVTLSEEGEKEGVPALCRSLAEALELPETALQVLLPSGLRIQDASSQQTLRELLSEGGSGGTMEGHGGSA